MMEKDCHRRAYARKIEKEKKVGSSGDPNG